MIGVNGDPSRNPGILVPHTAAAAVALLQRAAIGALPTEGRTMVRAELDDGQILLALNEVFVGHASHQSARYSLSYAGREEAQSSSGLIVASGTGATGWALSISRGHRRCGRSVALRPGGVVPGARAVAERGHWRRAHVRQARPWRRAVGGVPHERGRGGVRGWHGRRPVGFRLGPHAPRFGQRAAAALRAGRGTPESASTIPCTGPPPRPVRRACGGHAEAGGQTGHEAEAASSDTCAGGCRPCSACPGWRTC